MNSSQYDRIAGKYLEVNRGPINRHSVVPTFLDMAGDVAGFDVLDAACGSGFFSRLLKSGGARRVVGLDISPRQVSLARATPGPEGIEYRVGAVEEAGAAFGPEFDLVTGVYLLNYAATREGLTSMLTAIRGMLRPGGRFAGITHNPLFRFFDDIRYRRRLSRRDGGGARDGERVLTEIFGPDGKICDFQCYHWSRETYESAFGTAGFKDVRWVPMRVDEAGYSELGAVFWKEYETNPHLVGIAAEKL